jgi:GR25 family glycosyltransferase involved in LPS biosynthesis
MNFRDATSSVRSIAFKVSRAVATALPSRRMSAFGTGSGRIGSILVINLDRQPERWRRILRELGRFRTADGDRLVSITQRLAAIDARDGRAVAATADVDAMYRIGDQLFVQPDPRLEECFGIEEPVRMTRQEIAVARSHVEAWKAIASGADDHVLILEDDAWFTRGAAAGIDRGWQAALERDRAEGRPRLLYVSYKDAGGTAERAEVCDALFAPLRGLWFLSGYVLSREGAGALLRAMPVVGPVDLWINYRFTELGALALSSPAILQREDSVSQNSYSVLPYLARAGIVDAGAGPMRPAGASSGPVLAWTSGRDQESLAMALSMLGQRVRMFDGDEDPVQADDLASLGDVFDALVDAPLAPGTLSAAIEETNAKFIFEIGATSRFAIDPAQLPELRTTILSDDSSNLWTPLCNSIGLAEPPQAFPVGAPRGQRMFRDDRPRSKDRPPVPPGTIVLDDSPWILPGSSAWQPQPVSNRPLAAPSTIIVNRTMSATAPQFVDLVETFPGNMALFAKEGLVHSEEGTRLIISREVDGNRPLQSGAFASVRSFDHGRFEAEIRAARGSGLVTGFFLHRDLPRQEIDIELPGGDPSRMLVNVYFNPGDDGAAMGFGYRGSPCRIDLDFDTTSDFHLYAIDWEPDRITWSVDGKIVHERLSWDPTPIPHLPMRLHGNLWSPRSEELAGRLDLSVLPAATAFRNIMVLA